MTAAIVTRARMGTDWTPPDKAEVLRWLAELDRLLDVAAAAAKGRYGVSPGDNPYRGLYVGADELDQLLARAPALPLLADWACSAGMVTSGSAGSLSSQCRRRYAPGI
jgi:hypothetical protein